MTCGILDSQGSWTLDFTLLSHKLLICKTDIKILALITSQGGLSSSNRMVLVKVFYTHIGDRSYQKLDGENGVGKSGLLGPGTRLLQVFCSWDGRPAYIHLYGARALDVMLGTQI